MRGGMASLRVRLGVAAALLAAGGVPNAEPIRLHEGMGGVADLGATRCDYYLYIHPNGPNGFNQAVLYWLEGYVHARTGKTIDAFLVGVPGGGRWTLDRIGEHVLDYCTANPEATVADAIGDLWQRMTGGA